MSQLLFRHELLLEMTTAAFRSSGSPEDEAALMAEHLVDANLTGHDSHGVAHIPLYLGLQREGTLQAGQSLKILKDGGATLLVSAARGYGHVLNHRAMELAIERARRHRLCALALTDGNHNGRLGAFVLQAARAGMIGLMWSGSGGYAKTTAPFGGTGGWIGTAPLAAAFPSHPHLAVVLDMATSALANGAIRELTVRGLPVPPGVLQDAQGRPTTDGRLQAEGAKIRPLGGEQGYKGTMLAFLTEVLSGILTGYGHGGMTRPQVHGTSSFFLVLDVAAFLPLERFKDDVDKLVAFLKATEPLPGQEVLYPGERGMRTEQERRAHGVPLPRPVVDKIQAELDRQGMGLNLAAQAIGEAPA